jgi:hypothetical protein
MTHRYSRDNEGKRGTSWLLMHCAICGDLLQRHDVALKPSERVKHGMCGCTEQLQRCRRLIRDEYAAKAVAAAEREARAPVTRPDYSDPVTKLGA